MPVGWRSWRDWTGGFHETVRRALEALSNSSIAALRADADSGDGAGS
jgi:hypothetical protein